MNEDETRVSGPGERSAEPEHRSGWAQEDQTASAAADYEGWHQGASQPPVGGWSSSGSWPGRSPYASDAPYARAQTPPQPSSKQTRGLGWLLGAVVVVLAGLVAIGLVVFFTQGRSSDSSENTANTVASGGESQSPSSTTSSTSQTTASLPGGHTSCTQGGGTIDNTTQATLTAGTFSCQFADDAITQALQQVQNNPGTTNYSFSQFSESTGDSYNFTCTRQSHLSTCSTTSATSGSTLQFAVQDSTQ